MLEAKFTRGEPLEGYFHPRQTTDGTIFHIDMIINSSYVKYNGNKVKIHPSWNYDYDLVQEYACFGNTLFWFVDGKIYKALFHPPGEIKIALFRKLEKDERFEGQMLFSRWEQGRKFIYRACDEPKDGVKVDINEQIDRTLDFCKPEAIHRNKLIYRKTVDSSVSSAAKVSQNIIMVSIPKNSEFSLSFYANDDSNFIYFTDRFELHALNTSTMEIEMFKSNVLINEIAGIHDEKITVSGNENGKPYLCTAPLPFGRGQ